MDSVNAPGAGDIVGPSQAQSSDLTSDEESKLLDYLNKLGTADQKGLSDWITTRQNLIQDRLNELRRQEHMRPLAPNRMQEVVRILETNYGPEHLHSILEDLETKGVVSFFYQGSKMDRELSKEQELKKENE